MVFWLFPAILFAALEALALTKNLPALERVAKPAVVICLFIWLYVNTGLQGSTFWFGVGLLFSLAGDVLLMFSLDRMFLFGLGAFLLAHSSYIAGFKDQYLSASGGLLLVVFVLTLSMVRLIRRIISSIRAKGQNRLVVPVIVYSTALTIMLLGAMTTIFDPAWTTGASFLVSAGAFLFFVSDIVLAWNKFVAPIRNGRRLNIALYHLGQIGLIAGIIGQFGS
ncbi:MAG: lysoplasmalogenase [Chloroflexi bacterium]|nr:lysoplasmalogenase [Chloroflexota bacterium]